MKKPQVNPYTLFSKVFGWKHGPEDYNEHVTAWQSLPKPWKGELQ